MDKVLILGANGFTGKHFQNYIQKMLLHHDYSFVGVDISHPKEANILELRCMDLTHPQCVHDLLLEIKPDYLMNFAGSISGTHFDQLVRMNLNITENVIEAVRSQNLSVKNILLIGSAAEYGLPEMLPCQERSLLKPVTLYGLCKKMQTQLAEYYTRNYGIRLNIARTFNLIGRGISDALSIGSFFRQISEAQPGASIDVGNLNSKRDYVDIEDAVDAYWKILMKGKPGEVYNVCRGSSVSMEEIIQAMIHVSGKNLTVSMNESKMKERDVDNIYGNNEKLKTLAWDVTCQIQESIEKLFS